MNIPGFTSEFALPPAGRGYRQVVNAADRDRRASVSPATAKGGGGLPQSCCCGEGEKQLCASVPCAKGCQFSCKPDPSGLCRYILADCFCGPGKSAAYQVSRLGQVGAMA